MVTASLAQPQQKSMRSWGALALLCGLALACTTMYMTADGADMIADETTLLELSKATKTVSTDIEKVGIIYTDVPDKGRVRLLNYFKEIESRIASEVADRKKDIASIKTKMAKNRAYNAKQRSAMKKSLLAAMAVNAKKAQDDLDKNMAATAKKFAEVAAQENAINKANIKKFRKTRKTMRANKRAARKALRAATANQQRALSALDAETNAHIKSTEKSIAANAVQIKVNAKKAQDELAKANRRFQGKMFATRTEAAKGRSDLAKQANTMDKKIRAMISGKVQAETMRVSAHFAKIRAQMAEDRAHADHALKAMSTKLSAGLNAAKALQDDRFASTVKDIATARKEANDAVEAASKGFKLKMLKLEATAAEQVTKMKKQSAALKGVVTKNSMEQADVNRHVTAEIKRMIKLGNDHEATLSKKDEELAAVMKKNREANKHEMEQMANSFNSAMDKIKKQAKHDRAHAEKQLRKGCAALYATLAKNDKAQNAQNAKIEHMTKQMELDAADELREAKASFVKRLSGLTATVTKNNLKVSKKIKNLTGIVDADAVKNKEGRDALKDISDTNARNMKTAIRNAVSAGEQRALQVEKHMKDMTDKTRDAINLRVTTEISKLRKEIHGSIEDLRLSSKEAREGMKREILYAVRDSAKVAKDNLAASVKEANKKFVALEDKFSANEKSSDEARASIKKQIADDKVLAERQIADAVKAQNKALLALKTLTAEKIKKTNKDVTAYGKAVAANAKAVGEQMKANMESINGQLVAAEEAAKAHTAAAEKASAARHIAALESIKTGLAKAEEESDKKFTKAYADMGKDRVKADADLAAAALDIQKTMAKNSALYDSQFASTVKDMAAARKFAAEELAAARKDFTTEIVSITTVIKNQETKLSGAIALVSTETGNMVAANKVANRKLAAEIKRVFTLTDTNAEEGRKERGALRKVISDHKQLALEERNALAKRTTEEFTKVRSKLASDRNAAATELTAATKKLNLAMLEAKEKQDLEYKGLKGALAKAELTAATAVTNAKAEFSAKLTDLTNTVTNNNQKYERSLQQVTKVAHDWKKASGADRDLLKKQIVSMETDLNKAIVKAIEYGEAQATRVQERSLRKIDAAATMLLTEVGEQVETMADDVFSAVNENRAKIADNYLALKAYCGAGSSNIITYVGKGKGSNLLSLGDLMSSVAAVSSVHTKNAEGTGAGSDTVPAIFNGGKQKVSRSLSKTNGLVNEWSSVINQVRARWPYGLGHYLLSKAMFAMQGDGLLTVGKSGNKFGQYVYINGQAVGLSNRLVDFDKLAAKKLDYEKMLAKITAKLPKHKGKVAKKQDYMPAPEWQGD